MFRLFRLFSHQAMMCVSDQLTGRQVASDQHSQDLPRFLAHLGVIPWRENGVSKAMADPFSWKELRMKKSFMSIGWGCWWRWQVHPKAYIRHIFLRLSCHEFEGKEIVLRPREQWSSSGTSAFTD
jgi:hypothetical protein